MATKAIQYNTTRQMKESYLENEYIELWIEDGIIHAIYKPNLKIMTLEIVKQIVSTRLKVSNGITRSLFTYLCNAMTIDKASRKYLAEGDAMKYLSANAILVDNPVARLAAHIYIHVDKPGIPTKFFTDKALALAWLEQYKDGTKS